MYLLPGRDGGGSLVALMSLVALVGFLCKVCLLPPRDGLVGLGDLFS